MDDVDTIYPCWLQNEEGYRDHYSLLLGLPLALPSALPVYWRGLKKFMKNKFILILQTFFRSNVKCCGAIAVRGIDIDARQLKKLFNCRQVALKQDR